MRYLSGGLSHAIVSTWSRIVWWQGQQFVFLEVSPKICFLFSGLWFVSATKSLLVSKVQWYTVTIYYSRSRHLKHDLVWSPGEGSQKVCGVWVMRWVKLSPPWQEWHGSAHQSRFLSSTNWDFWRFQHLWGAWILLSVEVSDRLCFAIWVLRLSHYWVRLRIGTYLQRFMPIGSMPRGQTAVLGLLCKFGSSKRMMPEARIAKCCVAFGTTNWSMCTSVYVSFLWTKPVVRRKQTQPLRLLVVRLATSNRKLCQCGKSLWVRVRIIICMGFIFCEVTLTCIVVGLSLYHVCWEIVLSMVVLYRCSQHGGMVYRKSVCVFRFRVSAWNTRWCLACHRESTWLVWLSLLSLSEYNSHYSCIAEFRLSKLVWVLGGLWTHSFCFCEHSLFGASPNKLPNIPAFTAGSHNFICLEQ